MSLEVPAALLLGLLGSLHCAVMCGPLALALPVAPGSGRAALVGGRLAYNLGRAATYALLGTVVGLLGHGVRLAGLQRALSLGAAAAILVHLLLRLPAVARRLAALRARSAAGRRLMLAAPLARWSSGMQRLLAPRLRGRPGSLWVFGMLNGLLPCGLVGVALAGAAATGGALAGARFMALFGLGTLPLMLATALFGGAASARYGRRLQRWAPVALAVLALLFLVRGIGLPLGQGEAHAATGAAAPHAAAGEPAPCPLHAMH